MNKRIVSCIITGALVVCGVSNINPSIAHAVDTTQNQAGPTVTVNKPRFLLEVGQPFNFEKALGLKVTDAKDGDITSQVKVPTIPTDKINRFTFTLKATNSKGLVASKDITINVIKIADEVKLNNISEAKTYELSKLVTGITKGLTTSLSSIDEKNGNFVVKVSDGITTITKTVKLNVTKLPEIGGSDNKSSKSNASKSSEPKKTSAGVNNTSKPGLTAKEGDVPISDVSGNSSISSGSNNSNGSTTKDSSTNPAISSDLQSSGNNTDKKEDMKLTGEKTGELPKTGDLDKTTRVLGISTVMAGSVLAYLMTKKRK